MPPPFTIDPPQTSDNASRINVMLVDDSAVIRGALKRILKEYPDINIISAVSNGEDAISSAKRHQPDIVIMDIEMPVMDGITALPKVLEVSAKSKVVMFSSLTDKGAAITMKALSLGAVECLVKPSASEPIGEGSEFQRKLINTIRSLAPNRISQKPSQPAQSAGTKPTESVTLYDDSASYKGKPNLVMIGSSTGGPQALFEVLKHLKGFDIPIIVTQHMPAKFTTILAEHITKNTGITAHEGAEGMVVEAGKIYVAPGGYHMTLARNEHSQTIIKLDDGPQINFCKPAVDPMFKSAIDLYGNKALGIILTGMGNDGLGGAEVLVKKGGRLIAQDKETSVVWGMPGAVAQAGLCSKILPLQEIGPCIKKIVTG